MSRLRPTLLAFVLSTGAGAASAQPADVIHWWTSGDEMKAVNVSATERRL